MPEATMSAATLALVVLASGAGTYLWRALGVVLAGRIRTDSVFFEWVGCVAYAMIAGLTMRIVLLPSGTLAQTQMEDRLIACAIALGVHYLSRKNLFAGVGAGFIAIVALTAWRGLA